MKPLITVYRMLKLFKRRMLTTQIPDKQRVRPTTENFAVG